VMTDNLSQLVKNGPTEEAVVFSETDLHIEEEQSPQEEVVEQDSNTIEIAKLSDWFETNVDNFPGVRKPTITITGVDPAEQLLITVPMESDEAGVEKRKIIIFNDANIRPVLDRPAMDMQVYNHGFRIVYDLGGGIFVKSYGVRTGLVSVFCNDIDDMLIPYGIVRAKKKDESIEVIRRNPESVRQRLDGVLDIEALQLRYKQSSKAEGLRTNIDAIKWLLDRQATIEDINHHLQIDNVIIDTLA
jgi:hypothetical protein